MGSFPLRRLECIGSHDILEVSPAEPTVTTSEGTRSPIAAHLASSTASNRILVSSQKNSSDRGIES
jgi:hypothetical protein